MLEEGKVYVGTSRHPDDTINSPEYLILKLANRHGLITGATGTGKTVSLQILAEGFSNAGVPVFASDIKGDLSGLAALSDGEDFLKSRAENIGFAEEYVEEAFPTIFWDLFGEQGHPIRTTISEMGPLLLAELMDLNPTQEGVLNIAFKIADDEGLLLLDLKDLQALLADLAERSKEISGLYGNVSKRSVGAIQRQLLVLEQQGAEMFFGEPALAITDLMRTTRDGRGMINILASDRLMSSPRLYATFLLWLLSELFEELPEVGDPERPRLVFFFDEAHLLFDRAPKILIEKVEQVVKLIRSKGVGVYFVTQNPVDVPDSVLSQLGNRIQHALRAYTPRERKAVKTAAETFRPNPAFDAFEMITQLGVGEALVSSLQKKGVPSIVQRTLIRPPSSRLGPLSDKERQDVVSASPLLGQYSKALDRESAFEVLQKRAAEAAAGKVDESRAKTQRSKTAQADRYDYQGRQTDTGFRIPDIGGSASRSKGTRTTRTGSKSTSSRQSTTEAMIKSIARSVGTQLGRAIVRGVLGSISRR